VDGPFAVGVVWVRDDTSLADRLTHLFAGVSAVPSELGFWFARVVVLTNLDAKEAQQALELRFRDVEQFIVLGATEFGECLDHHPELRAAMPSVLGLRDLDSLITPDARQRSSLEIEVAQELARVFWPTRAYAHARAVLAQLSRQPGRDRGLHGAATQAVRQATGQVCRAAARDHAHAQALPTQRRAEQLQAQRERKLALWARAYRSGQPRRLPSRSKSQSMPVNSPV
jgi:hypothetical protein